MLGMSHKINLGIAVQQLEALFPKLGHVEEPVGRERLRFWLPLHAKQLATPADFSSSNVLTRFLFGLVHCYNGLLQSVMYATSVKAFQWKLQFGLLQYADSGAGEWHLLYASRWKLLPRTRRYALFVSWGSPGGLVDVFLVPS